MLRTLGLNPWSSKPASGLKRLPTSCKIRLRMMIFSTLTCSARLERVTLIRPSGYVSFSFPFDDLVLDGRGPRDVPIEPEFENPTCMTVLCVRGDDEHRSAGELSGTGTTVVVHGEGHRAKAGDGTSKLVLRELRLGLH